MNFEQERAAFEAWYRHHHGSRDVYALDESGEYVDKCVQGAFNVWQARAALQSQAVDAAPPPTTPPDGWQLVPKRPTVAMLEAAQKAWLNDTMRRTTTLWDAMLAAAPKDAEA